MKKIHVAFCITSALLSVFVSVAHAQKSITFFFQPQSTRGGVFYVPTSGANDADYAESDRKFTLGLRLGTLLSMPINDKMSFSTGLCYSGYGQKSSYRGHQPIGNLVDDFTITSTAKLHYLQIPAFVSIQKGTDKKISFFASGGIYFGFLLGYKHEIIVMDDLSNGDWEEATKIASGGELAFSNEDSQGNESSATHPFLEKPFRSADFGITLAGGFSLNISEKISVPISLNVNQGLRDVKNETSQWTDSNASDAELYWKHFYTGSDPNKTSKYKNSAVGLSIGLRIAL